MSEISEAYQRGIERMQAKLETAREALTFYADLENWGSKQRTDGTTKLGPILRD